MKNMKRFYPSLLLFTAAMATNGFSAHASSPTGGSGPIAQPNDTFVTTCASVHDSYQGVDLYLNNGCFQWNGTNSVGDISGPNCVIHDPNAAQTNVFSYGYTQITSTHAYFHCDFGSLYGPFGPSSKFHEYMDVFYNGSYTHHATGG